MSGNKKSKKKSEPKSKNTTQKKVESSSINFMKLPYLAKPITRPTYFAPDLRPLGPFINEDTGEEIFIYIPGLEKTGEVRRDPNDPSPNLIQNNLCERECHLLSSRSMATCLAMCIF